MSNVAARLLFRALSGAMMTPQQSDGTTTTTTTNASTSAASSSSDLMYATHPPHRAQQDEDVVMDEEVDWDEESEGDEEGDEDEKDGGDDDAAAREAAQSELRKRIMLIQTDSTLGAADKAKKIQELMTSGWSQRQQQRGVTHQAKNKLENRRSNFDLVTDADRQPTYHDASLGILGCKHYQRAAKLQAHCCGKWDTCRFCHDEVSDHNIIRNMITTMMCMYCGTVQPASQDCTNDSCRKRVARYYCKECKLWDSDPRKNIYHCADCGICRIGKGLGVDYFHCKKCNVCMAISLEGRHKCIERNLESDCPICGEYMFTSTTTVIFMPCGHCIHYKCHQEYIQTSYQCPTCLKSLADMTDYFRRIDLALSQQQMPPEYDNLINQIYCNDCEKKSYAKFHFMYHKCASCFGYNTKVLNTLELDQLPPNAPMAPPPGSNPPVSSTTTEDGSRTSSPVADGEESDEEESGDEVEMEQERDVRRVEETLGSQVVQTQHAIQEGGVGSSSSSLGVGMEEDGVGSSSGGAGSSRRRRSSVHATLRRASMRTTPMAAFWCHQCQSETTTTLVQGTIRCDTCMSDFIEEM
ncbi:hypothetical protein HDV00_003608 [Rhizophlyctis rosea]|nr:hypothetical protein HDV00_003608 [Rhizophlyctis rosea]